METADDTSETQSQTHNDLMWDHTGDVESDPLLGRETERQNDRNRPAPLQLSHQQAQDLLHVLDHTRFVLESYVGQHQHELTESSFRESGPWRGGAGGGVRRSWWAFHCCPARRRSIARYIFLITLILQALNLVVVSLIEGFPRHNSTAVYGTCITMILLQLLNLCFIVMVSMRLVRQLSKHKVSLLLLAQSYLSTLLLFAGIYTLTYRLQSQSWKFIQEDVETDPILVIELYSKFLFFSVSTATLCGSDNVLPKFWYNCLFAALQMLLSFIYFASILGQTLSSDTQYWLGFGPNTNTNTNSTTPTSQAVQHRRASSATSSHPRPDITISSSFSGPTTSASAAALQAAPAAGSVVSALRVPLSGAPSSNQAWQNYGSGSHTVVVMGGGGSVEGGGVVNGDQDTDTERARSVTQSPFPL
ncbi:uncharacterized protein LOC143287496 isoform X2 [Babylonia areolata]|uniref:uncharacterized protein LOC143287496 isoform X2 n=1 Tax=Babylonia areolata TaxID=304850 RepID=UPI003FD49948